MATTSGNSSDKASCSTYFGISEDKTKYWIPDCDDHLKPTVGRSFKTLEEGVECYKQYALICGFSTRNSTNQRVKGITKVKWMVCTRQGEKNSKNSKGIRNTSSDRCYCPAKVVFTRRNGYYLVKDFEERHSHAMMSSLAQKFAKSNFDFTEEQQQWVLDCSSVHIGPTKAFQLYEKMVGDPLDVGSNVKQFKNSRRGLLAKLKGTDSQILINRLTMKKTLCSSFYFNYKLNESDQLVMLFWADAQCKKNYSVFGENVGFDSTYRTNK